MKHIQISIDKTFGFISEDAVKCLEDKLKEDNLWML